MLQSITAPRTLLGSLKVATLLYMSIAARIHVDAPAALGGTVGLVRRRRRRGAGRRDAVLLGVTVDGEAVPVADAPPMVVPPGASADRQSTPMDVWPIHGFTYCIPPLFDQMAHVNEQQQQQQLQTSAPPIFTSYAHWARSQKSAAPSGSSGAGAPRDPRSVASCSPASRSSPRPAARSAPRRLRPTRAATARGR